MQLSSTEERFFNKIKVNHNGCWVWTGYKGDRGYGRMKIDGKLKYTHRYSYELENGPIPEELELDHWKSNIDPSSCSTSCCNPNHLEAVTRRENLIRSPRHRLSAQANGKKTGPVNGRANGLGNRRNNLPEGVYSVGKRFQARIYDPEVKKLIYLGSFSTPEEASDYYRLSRERLNSGLKVIPIRKSKSKKI